jgi:hypothetical protein
MSLIQTLEDDGAAALSAVEHGAAWLIGTLATGRRHKTYPVCTAGAVHAAPRIAAVRKTSWITATTGFRLMHLGKSPFIRYLFNAI